MAKALDVFKNLAAIRAHGAPCFAKVQKNTRMPKGVLTRTKNGVIVNANDVNMLFIGRVRNVLRHARFTF